MNIANVQPNTAAWLELRKNYDTASEASAALGVSKYTSRTALMHQKFTGEAEEVSNAKQELFQRGHDAESAARPLAEEIIGSELYPITATLEVDGLKLLASLDGATMDEEVIWEHKLWSVGLAANVVNNTLPAHYTVQMDQQLLVSGAKKCLFMVSDGTKENMVHCWYETTPEKQADLISGWKQFNADLAVYVPAEVIVPPVAAPQMGLPAVSITVNGSIALVDNLDKFGAALTAYVERINKKPETDQDFADLEATVKTLKTAEEALDAAEAGALAQTDSIDAMRKTVALYRETARTNRLLVEKLVKAEKENRRMAIVSDAAADFVTHMKGLNERLGQPFMPTIATDFLGVIKGLKTLDSMKDKVATELARAKIEANAVADRIQVNMQKMVEVGDKVAFPDAATLVLKAPDDLAAIVANRVAEADRKAEELRESVRQEEAAKLAAAQPVAAPAPVVQPGPAAATVTHEAVVSLMPASVRQAMAPKPDTPPALALGEISGRLGFNVTSAFLSTLGFEATTVKAAKLYHEQDFGAICEAIKTHISEVQDQHEAVAA